MYVYIKDGFVTSNLGRRRSHPMWRRSGMALDASCSAAVVRTARAEWRVLNQAAASAGSVARSTQLWTASGECNSNIRASEIQITRLSGVVQIHIYIHTRVHDVNVNSVSDSFEIRTSDTVSNRFGGDLSGHFYKGLRNSYCQHIACFFMIYYPNVSRSNVFNNKFTHSVDVRLEICNDVRNFLE